MVTARLEEIVPAGHEGVGEAAGWREAVAGHSCRCRGVRTAVERGGRLRRARLKTRLPAHQVRADGTRQLLTERIVRSLCCSTWRRLRALENASLEAHLAVHERRAIRACELRAIHWVGAGTERRHSVFWSIWRVDGH